MESATPSYSSPQPSRTARKAASYVLARRTDACTGDSFHISVANRRVFPLCLRAPGFRPHVSFTAVRVKELPDRTSIDLYESTDKAASWRILPRPVQDTGG